MFVIAPEVIWKKPRRTVLVIGMLDSVHLGRWLEQFKTERIDFLIFGSKKFKSIHPKLIDLLKVDCESTYRLAYRFPVNRYLGYLDFFRFMLPEFFGIKNARSRRLKSILKSSYFDFVHCIEIQGSGYLIESLDFDSLEQGSLIVTNWGSDIYFYGSDPIHVSKIKRLLKIADFYSAECNRDYKLARNLGFSGVELPCIPNAGGFDLSQYPNFLQTSIRRTIVVKCYGGTFGMGSLSIDVIREILPAFPDHKVYFYSVTDDLIHKVKALQQDFLEQIDFSTTKKALPRIDLMEIFSSSRVYLGCSKSDGISTSFLEALMTGAYPIQTDTSCANEWVLKGALASIVPLEKTRIIQELTSVLLDNVVVDRAQVVNRKLAVEYLSENHIKKDALKFYNSLAN